MEPRGRAWIAGAALVLLTPLAVAYPESDASLLRMDVLATSHAPAVVPPHTQWEGFLALRPGHNVTAVQYQVCRVGSSCFAPPAPATRLGNDTFSFHTSDYLAGGKPVDFQPGWRIGVQWLLTERLANGTLQTTPFPHGPDASDPACAGEAALGCQERHYFVFNVQGAAKPASGAWLGLMIALLGTAIAWRTRRGDA